MAKGLWKADHDGHVCVFSCTSRSRFSLAFAVIDILHSATTGKDLC